MAGRGAGQRVVVPVPVLGVELDEPIEPLLPLLPLLLGLLLELPLAPMPLVPDEPELPELPELPVEEPLEPELEGDVLLPLPPMLVEPPEPEGEVLLPLVPAVLPVPDRAPAVSLPFWPQAARDTAAAAIAASVALRRKRDAFIWNSLVGVWEDVETAARCCLRPL